MWLMWIGFLLLIAALLALDLGVFHRKPHAFSIGEAFAWTSLWVALSLLFNAFVFLAYQHQWLGIGATIGHELTGRQAALQFFTAYVVEKSLSLDNVFIIAMIFAYFRIPLVHQHRLLFWGVLGAIVLRGIMIFAGLAAVSRFSWMIYVFGALLLVTAVRMLVARHDTIEPENSLVVRLLRRLVPITSDMRRPQFLVRVDGKLTATPFLLALVTVESADVLFAVDSVPAVIAVTRDPFLVFSSNVFAILGLRSLYFALAAAMERFRFMKMSLVFLLAYIGVKMMLTHYHPIPTGVSLLVILGILSVGIAASLIAGEKDTAKLVSPVAAEMEELAQLTFRGAKRVILVTFGASAILVGTALLFLPGPGTVVILLGLSVLATQFAWARALLTRCRNKALAGLESARLSRWLRKSKNQHPPNDAE